LSRTMNGTRKRSTGSRPTVRPLPVVLLCVAVVLCACAGGGRNRRLFRVQDTAGTVSGARAPIVGERGFVYFVSEALTGPAGTDLNSDGDMLDEIAVVVRVQGRTETVLGVAARDAALIGGQVWLHVDEAEDGFDWNGVNGATDQVLLHWSLATGVVQFVDTLDPSPAGLALRVVDFRLLYTAETAALGGDETSLRRIVEGDPLTPVVVENQVGAGTLDPIWLGVHQGLCFFHVDETVEGADRNGDGDATDVCVLVVLDGQTGSARVVNVGLALRDPTAPFGAFRRALDDWSFAFLVDEAAQGATNLNDPTAFANPLVPDSCAGTPDVDTADQVLFQVMLKSFAAGSSTPLNTGIAGRDRVVVVDGFVATLSDEADAGCDLNEDGDALDTIARWSGLSTPVAPPRDPSQLHAVETGIPGGAMGLAGLLDRFVIVVDEAQDADDLDGKPGDHDLLAWLEPRDGAGALWSFAHQSSKPPIGTGVFEDTNGDGLGDPDKGASEPFASPGWMAAESTLGRLPISFRETLPGTNPLVPSLNVNVDCAFFAKDADLVDELPVWLDFEGRVLDFDGMGIALATGNPGLELARFTAFFRVSEAEDSFDHNEDGDLGDVVLLSNPVSACSPRFLTTASNLPGPVVHTDGLGTATVFVDETLDGVDYNQDGDADDLVVRYFEY